MSESPRFANPKRTRYEDDVYQTRENRSKPRVSVFPILAAPISEIMAAELAYQERRKRPDGLFTVEQVQRIVRDTVEARDRQLRDEYDQTLYRVLQEHHDTFSRFQQDYIRRFAAHSAHAESYIS